MTRFCAYTFKSEEELPEGQKLLACGRCRDIHYLDEESQQRHWPVHRLVCRRPTEEADELRELEESSIEDCLVMFAKLVNDPDLITGRAFLRCFQRILDYLKTTRPRTDTESKNLRDNIGRYCLAPLLRLSDFKEDCQPVLDRIWAIPGLANYFLSEDILLSPVMQRLKEVGKPPPPKPQFDGGDVLPNPRYPPAFQLPLPYTSLIMVFFQISCMFTQDYTARNTKIAEAVCKRSMDSWMCQYARISVPTPSLLHKEDKDLEALGCRTRYLTDLVIGFKNQRIRSGVVNSKEIVPGMTLKQLIQVLMEDELYLFAFPTSTLPALLFLYARTDMFAHKAFSAIERLDLLDYYYEHWNCPARMAEFPAEYDAFPLKNKLDLWTCFNLMITGFSTKTLLEMYDIATDPANHGRFGSITIPFLRIKREFLLLQVLPQVTSFWNHPTEQMPEDVALLIANYFMPAFYDVDLNH